APGEPASSGAASERPGGRQPASTSTSGAAPLRRSAAGGEPGGNAACTGTACRPSAAPRAQSVQPGDGQCGKLGKTCGLRADDHAADEGERTGPSGASGSRTPASGTGPANTAGPTANGAAAGGPPAGAA